MERRNSERSVRVVLADDHVLVRDGLTLLFESMPGVQVMAEAATGEELLRRVEGDLPDLVITDVSMPGMGGIEAIGRLHVLHPGLPVIVLSMDDSIEVIKRVVALGARGYVLKNAPSRELEVAVRTVAGGGSYFSAAIASLLLRQDADGPADLLTARQMQVLKLVAMGLSSKRVGSELGLSPATVDVHRARIMRRLGIHQIAGLTRYAVKHGLLRDVAAPVPALLAVRGEFK